MARIAASQITLLPGRGRMRCRVAMPLSLPAAGGCGQKPLRDVRIRAISQDDECRRWCREGESWQFVAYFKFSLRRAFERRILDAAFTESFSRKRGRHDNATNGHEIDRERRTVHLPAACKLLLTPLTLSYPYVIPCEPFSTCFQPHRCDRHIPRKAAEAAAGEISFSLSRNYLTTVLSSD